MPSLPLPQTSATTETGKGFFGPSLELGRVAGIPIRLHWSFALILLWAALVNYSATSSVAAVFAGTAFLFAVFVCVVLHELGHSLTAMRFGVKTRSITLSPLGGIAALESSPKHWKEEFWITLAGPAVNAVIALLLLPLVILFASPEMFMQAPLTSPESFVFMLFFANVMLVAFNLLPAFPMDGGRLLRSVLTPLKGRLKATMIASTVGRTLAVALGILGLFASPFLCVIALFVFIAATAERKSVEMDEALSGMTVSEAMRESFETASHSDTINEGISIAFRTGQNTLPIMYDGQLLGLASLPELIRERHAGRGNERLHELVREAPAFVRPGDELIQVFHAMQRGQREVVPVVRETRLVGLLPQRSIYSLLQVRAA